MRLELVPTFWRRLFCFEPGCDELGQAIGLEHDINTLVFHSDGRVSIDTADVILTQTQKCKLEKKLRARIIKEI